jgi:A/G-specific adenine glycosylase
MLKARTMSAVPASELSPKQRRALATSLLAWYDRHRRDLPWRAKPGERPDPYRVWLSEIMLQQTTVAAVGPRFEAFLARWPNVAALAAASLDEVLHEWQGLGYYARARNLHACAKKVVALHAGKFPASEAALRALPGIGDYTAAAIAALAFDLKATPLDGNIERVIARIFAAELPLPSAKPRLRALAASLTSAKRPGDYAQAAMDLGATVCTPRRPKCILCPWQESCRARALGIAETLPLKRAKPEKPRRFGIVFWIGRGDGAVLLRRRPEQGLLGGMMEFPSTPWRDTRWTEEDAPAQAPLRARWRVLAGTVRHSFTHFDLELGIWAGTVARGNAVGVWVKPADFSSLALPTLMKKVANLVMRGDKALGKGRWKALPSSSNVSPATASGGAMTEDDHIASLRAQHRSLEEAIDQESHRPFPNLDLVTDLKRQKLRIKDQIAQIEHAH